MDMNMVEETDKEKVIKKFGLQVGDMIKLGPRRSGAIVTIKRFTEKSIIVPEQLRLRFRDIVKNNYVDIEKNLSDYYR